MEEIVYTTGDIAEMVKVSEWWIRQQCESKKLRAYKFAGKWRIKKSDYEAWFESQLHEPSRKDPVPAVKGSMPTARPVTLAEIKANAA